MSNVPYWNKRWSERSKIVPPPKQLIEVVKNELSNRPKTLLDFGCGMGRWTSTLSSLCKSYHGVDSSLEAMLKCQQNNSGVRVGWPLDDSYNAIFLCTVLIHEESPLAILQDLRSRLVKRGKLLLIESVWSPAESKSMTERHNHLPEEARYLFFRTSKEWQQLLQGAYFSVAKDIDLGARMHLLVCEGM